ncbi:MAG: GHKL domain-containing protein [Gammaproteobacteria bacterium]|nr:GHKL domain-containing protein [Gammaproteobacteria bacterium]
MTLNRRIILSATLVLVVFISLTALTLERAFVDSNESALRDTLTSQLYVLMAVAEVENKQLRMPSDELDALLGLPSSGIYAFITDSNSKVMWQSSSALGVKPPMPVALPGGEKQFTKNRINKSDYYSFAYGVDWSAADTDIALTFTITTDMQSFDKQINKYRKTLWSWLVAMAILLLISQAIILRWGLSPLRKVGEELSRIEAGEQQQIEDRYPQEIEQLSDNINILLTQEREQKTRYRNALGDLAHSLKTPLAVMQSSIDRNKTKDKTMPEQISRMNSIVEYQLQRAATAGSSPIGTSVAVNPVVTRMLDSLNKVYRDRNIKCNVDVDKSVRFKGDEGDLMEVLGNLLDNAFKWAHQQIDIQIEPCGKQIQIIISDDGPGISPEKINDLLKRGVRADQATAGHGIGLSIVNNIVIAYHGTLDIKPSTLGGISINLTL